MTDGIITGLEALAVPIQTIMPDPRNAREHPDANLEAIKASLLQYGQRRPIVVNSETQMIEAGNGVWQAARDLGWDRIAAVYVTDDEVTAKEVDTGGMDMALTGFDTTAIESLMTATPPGSAPAVDHRTLAERFIVPPFSVLDARQGYWQRRKRAWLSLGIQSELGRGDAAGDGAGMTMHDSADGKRRRHKGALEQNRNPAPGANPVSKDGHRAAGLYGAGQSIGQVGAPPVRLLSGLHHVDLSRPLLPGHGPRHGIADAGGG